MKKCICRAAAGLMILASLSGCGSSGDLYPPTVPTGIQAAAVSSDSVQLNWTASQDDLLMLGYRVYRDGSRVGSTPLTTYTDTGLSPGSSYGYRVSAYDWIGNESAKSTTLFVAIADGSAPSAPANLQGTAVSTSRIDLAWTASTDNVGVTGYRVYRNAAVIGTTAGTSFSDTGLAEYTTYVYRVAAYDAEGNESSMSSPLTATTVDGTPPSMPSNLQGAAVSTSRIDLTWTASTDNAGVTGYRIYRNGTAVGTTASTGWSDTGLSEATSYSYTVAATDEEGNESVQCGAVAVYTADATAPSVPSNLQGTAASTSRIDLTWTASTDNVGVSGYRVYRNGSLVASPAGTSYSDTGLSEATSYSYTVAATDASGNVSNQCGAVAVSTLDATAPSVPSNLQGTAASTSRIDLTWTASTDNVGVSGYRVYRNGSLVASPAGTSYSDTGLTEATSYSYTVAATDASGNASSQCGAVAVSTLDGTAPSVPTNLQATVVSTSRIDLSWTASTDNVGVAGYRVYRDGSLVASPSGTTYSDTGLSAGTTYAYRVAAADAAGNVSAQCTAVNATTQSGTWGGTVLIGTASGDRGHGIGLDSGGNIYVAGYTAGNLDGETNSGGNDIFLTKYDASGARQWTRLSGTAVGDESGWGAVTVDGSGNIYVTGYTSGNLDGETNAGGSDAVLIKYNASGTRQWTRLLGTAGSDSAWSVAVDGSGNVYISGFTDGNLGGETNSGGTDAFLAKYNSAGTLQWTRLLGNATLTYSYAVAVAASGNVYISGMTRGSLDGETNVGIQDIFVAKYNSSGTRQWTRMLGSTVFDYCYSVAVDGSENVYAAGHSYGHFDGGTNSDGSGTTEDIFLAKFNSSGTKQWSVFHGAAGNDVTSGLAVDSGGNAYISGNTNAALDGFTPAGNHDLILIKYDTSGTWQWTSMLGTTAGDYARSVAADASGTTYMTGHTSGNLDGATNSGGNDGFIVKYDTGGTLQ